MSVGDRIKLVRGGISRPKFIEMFQISKSTLVNYETGVSSPNADFLAAVYERFNVDPGWLLTGKGSMQPGGTMHGQGIKDYPEVGAEDVLEVLDALERRLQDIGKVVAPEKKAVTVRLLCEIMVDRDRENWANFNKSQRMDSLDRSLDRVTDLLV